ncbi:MAG: hypothetical protein Q8K29_10985, partial [Polaromonas sp.]|nr:hypothetical protein [Polaromonas sp.]
VKEARRCRHAGVARIAIDFIAAGALRSRAAGIFECKFCKNEAKLSAYSGTPPPEAAGLAGSKGSNPSPMGFQHVKSASSH